MIRQLILVPVNSITSIRLSFLFKALIVLFVLIIALLAIIRAVAWLAMLQIIEFSTVKESNVFVILATMTIIQIRSCARLVRINAKAAPIAVSVWLVILPSIGLILLHSVLAIRASMIQEYQLLFVLLVIIHAKLALMEPNVPLVRLSTIE